MFPSLVSHIFPVHDIIANIPHVESPQTLSNNSKKVCILLKKNKNKKKEMKVSLFQVQNDLYIFSR